MTQERINQIKHYTINYAYRDLKNLDYTDNLNVAFEVGKIFGRLERNLDRELYKELDKTEKDRNEMHFIVKKSLKETNNV